MELIERFERGETLAEIQGIPPEIGEALARMAQRALEAGRLRDARTLLEGMVVTNHRDRWAWTALSTVTRRLAEPVAARFCAEVAVHLAPADPQARLARAESLLVFPEDRAEALAALAARAPERGPAPSRPPPVELGVSARTAEVHVCEPFPRVERLDDRAPLRG